mgnify:CR=1 FL=1
MTVKIKGQAFCVSEKFNIFLKNGKISCNMRIFRRIYIFARFRQSESDKHLKSEIICRISKLFKFFGKNFLAI